MRVRDVMTRHVRTLRATDTLGVAAAVLRFRSFRHLPVLGDDDHVVGMLTPTDVLEATIRGKDRHRFPVSELMRRPVATVRADDDVAAAIGVMRRQGVHALPVVDVEERLVGVVTDVDVLAWLARGQALPRSRSSVPVSSVMSANPVTIEPDASLADASEALLQGSFRHLPVVDDGGRLVGMLSERDVRSRLGVDLESFPDATLEALSEPVRDAMTPDPLCVRSGAPIDEVLETFATERVGALPVVDDAEKLLGIVSYVDVVMWLREGDRRPA